MGILSDLIKGIKLKWGSGLYIEWNDRSTPWDKDAWEHDIFRGVVDAIATHAAKGRFKHVIIKDGRVIKTVYNSKIVKLLNEKPNPVMTAYDLKYRFISQMEIKTTAVAYIDWDTGTGEARAVYPVDYQAYEIRKVQGGGYALVFDDYEGIERVLPMESCIILKKYYTNNSVSGDGNLPLYRILDMSKASDEGFIDALNRSNKIRGMVKKKNSMLKSEDVSTGQKDFVERFNSAAKDGGILEIDGLEDFTPLKMEAYSANAAQMKEISNRIYTYMRTPEEIVQSKYSEKVGMAWYESVIEPIWDAFAQAVAAVYFTKHELECGNRLVVTGGVLMGTSYQTRINIIASTKEIGVLTTNEQRELLGYDPVEGGDDRQVSLNYVKAINQDLYQKYKALYQKNKEEENEDGTDGESESAGEEI